ncbi:hypothetical protein NDU88_001817 [Pleurodeles waltl]|uniref:Uncharacterized protein n=1 Tax=Pleurodeles waltl TaxID=8319 RepID=A0AAV7TIW5_PLEWA|nr:hypothetical protein NDU88_001817 [Pleurodeles waltl]
MVVHPKQAKWSQGTDIYGVTTDDSAKAEGPPLEVHTDRIPEAIRNTNVALELKIETVAQDVGLLQVGHRKLAAKLQTDIRHVTAHTEDAEDRSRRNNAQTIWFLGHV